MHIFVALLLLIPSQQGIPVVPTTQPGVEKRNSQVKTPDFQIAEAQQSAQIASMRSLDKTQPAAHNEKIDPHDASHDSLYRTYLWATIVGVAGGFIGLIVLICQTILTRQSANSAKDSAIAAIKSNQAWILTDLRATMGRYIVGDRTAITFCVNCRNVGNSPAWITEVRARFIVANEPLPQEPQLDSAEIIHATPWPIAPDDEPFSTREYPFETKGIQGLDFNGELFVVYGAVHYRDTFSERRRTTFGYRLLPGHDVRFERLSGYPKYNENT